MRKIVKKSILYLPYRHWIKNQFIILTLYRKSSIMHKKIILSVLFFYAVSSAIAQEKMLPSLETIGTGEIKVSPDRAVLFMDLTARSMNFNNAVQELNKKAALLEKELTSAGFVKTDLKTTGYTVNKNIIYTSGGPVDSGYIARQTFLVELQNDQQKIVKLVKSLSESKAGAAFSFSFTLSEQKEKEVQTELMKRAVADANQKAKILAEASGVTIQRILTITYGKTDYGPRPFASAMRKESQSDDNFSGFTVNELDLTEQVTITWEIAQQK